MTATATNPPTIDAEFHALIPALTPEQRDGLEQMIVAQGCLMPLVAWRGLLIDGHNRKTICDRLGIDYEVREMDFSDREAVKLWIIRFARNRRNLTEDQAAALALREMELMSEIAKREQRSDAGKASAAKRNGEDTVASPLKLKETKTRTRAAVAKAHKIPERKLRAVAAVAKVKPALVEKIKDGEMTVKQAAREVRQEKKTKDRSDAAAAADKIEMPDDCGVQLGDFRKIVKDIGNNLVDLIFTDPPYDRKALPLYGAMATEAARILKPGGSLICYLGQYQIHEVCQLVTPHLRLWWTLACLHTGTSARMTEYGIVVKWKPMLWFVKGTRRDKQTFVDDLIESKQEKGAHDWQQSEVEASYYIDKLTMPGEFVFDPFCGGGTTAVAAKKLKRRWLTCDTDEVAVKLARKRIHDAAV